MRPSIYVDDFNPRHLNLVYLNITYCLCACNYILSLLPLVTAFVFFLLQLVVDWLETNAKSNLKHYPEKIRYFTDGVMWEGTLGALQDGSVEANMVTEMVCGRCWVGGWI